MFNHRGVLVLGIMALPALTARQMQAQWAKIAPTDRVGADSTAPSMGEGAEISIWEGTARRSTKGILSAWLEVKNPGISSIWGHTVVLREYDCARKQFRDRIIEGYDRVRPRPVTIHRSAAEASWMHAYWREEVQAMHVLCRDYRPYAEVGPIALEWDLFPDRWGYVTTDDNGDTVYLDLQTLERGASRAKAWIKFAYSVPLGSAVESRSLWDIDCAAKRYRVTASTHYDSAGRAIDSSDPTESPSWTAPRPETVSEDLVGYLCAKGPLERRFKAGEGPPPDGP